MLTNKQLAEFAKKKLGVKSAYMWGDFGRIITNATIAQKAAQYPDRYTATRQSVLKSYVGKNYYGCDCVGLYKWFLWTDNDTHAIRYNSSTDRGTEGMYNVATEKGVIGTLSETPGLILYMKGHVGVYIGNGECVECTLGSYGDGIVRTKVNGRGWTHWLKMPEITYETEPEPQDFKIGDDVIINGDLYASANAVKASGTVSNKKTKITRYSAGAKHPYNTTGDLGWMNASDIKIVTAAAEEKPSSVGVATTVLALHNNNTRWVGSGVNKTVIAWIPQGATVTVYSGTEKKIGKYTAVKVLYNGKTGYCAKEYLK